MWLWLKHEIFKTESPKRDTVIESPSKSNRKIPIRFRSNTTNYDFSDEINNIRDKFVKIESEIKKYKRIIKSLSKPSLQLIKGQRTYSEERYRDGSVYTGE